MKNQNAIRRTTAALLGLVFALMTILSGCSKANPTTETTESAPTEAVESEPTQATETEPTEPAEPTEATEPALQDGERHEAVIVMEGMEETVQYEHFINQTLGVEMDYDYERFERRSDPEREVFVSVWDSADNPENYLELTASTQSAETVDRQEGRCKTHEAKQTDRPYLGLPL